ncbi:MAG: purine-nucleoside phosphorylase [Bacteroidales bacterium]|nr:purine-nucleoside phosphorylase [Bacteroidales bacterium]
MDERIERINKAADYIRGRLGGRQPKVALILGSGLGPIADTVKDQIVIPYKEIPGFPVSTAVGHKGNFISGELAGTQVFVMQGRFHYYEGYPMETVTIGVRVFRQLGIQFLFVFNAAGAANPAFKVGDMVMITDHINMMPNPLIGPNMEDFGPRFPDMTCPYDLELQDLARTCAAKVGVEIQEGVYFGSTGPTYETPAEVRFYRLVGADLLGMSTIPEVIVARHCGIRVFGMSAVTNVCNTTNKPVNFNDGDDVVDQAGKVVINIGKLLNEMLPRL